ncbi:MAG: hypothetical protein AAFO69_02000 [Bacteroidota bacterium]
MKAHNLLPKQRAKLVFQLVLTILLLQVSAFLRAEVYDEVKTATPHFIVKHDLRSANLSCLWTRKKVQLLDDVAAVFDPALNNVEEAISFHKEILVEGCLDVAEEDKVISMVAEHLIVKLNVFLNEHPIKLDTIKFAINENGEITTIKIECNRSSGFLMEELTMMLQDIDQLKNPSEGLLNVTILF